MGLGQLSASFGPAPSNPQALHLHPHFPAAVSQAPSHRSQLLA